MTYVADSAEMRQCLADVFARILNGDVKVEINQRYALADVAQAHTDLESRKTTGSTILVP
jgi:NADPH2:quinone reductase